MADPSQSPSIPSGTATDGTLPDGDDAHRTEEERQRAAADRDARLNADTRAIALARSKAAEAEAAAAARARAALQRAADERAVAHTPPSDDDEPDAAKDHDDGKPPALDSNVQQVMFIHEVATVMNLHARHCCPKHP